MQQGALARNERSTSRRLLLSSQRALHSSARALAEHDARQKQLGFDRALLAQEQAESKAQLKAALARLDQRHLELQMSSAQHVGAPVGGFVSGVNARLGQRLQPGQTVLNLLQQQDHANVLLLLPSQAMGSVAVGQSVRLRYAGYPYQKFGSPLGRVERVSKTPVRGVDLDLPLNPQALVYPVNVRVLPATEPHAGASFEPKNVVPGMQIEADVLVRRERLWRWLLQPLLKLWARL